MGAGNLLLTLRGVAPIFGKFLALSVALLFLLLLVEMALIISLH